MKLSMYISIFALIHGTVCSLHSMEPAKEYLHKPKSIAQLLEANILPSVSENGTLDLTEMDIESLDGLEQVPHQQEILKLYLNNNLLRTLSPSLFPHIVVLDVSNNPLESLPPTMLQGLVLLKQFILCNTPLHDIPPHFFDDLPRLTEINLSNNQLNGFHRELFKPLHALKKLNLSRNRIVDLDAEALCFQSKLTSLRLTGNQLSAIHPKLCSALVQLETLDLADNQITDFEAGSFDTLSKLKGLLVQGNRLRSLDPALLAHCTQLIELNLGHNQLTSISPKLIESLPDLRALNLQGNVLQIRENLSPETGQLIKEQRLFVGDPTILADEPIPQTAALLFKELHAQGKLHEIYYEHPKYEGWFLLNLSHRCLKNIDGIADLLPHPEEVIAIHAQNNYLEELPCETLSKFSQLTILDLRNNRIGSLTPRIEKKDNDSIPDKCQLSLPHLEILHLDGNCIKEISHDALSQVKKVTTLSMTRNQLELIEDGAFEHLTNLENCLLSNNNLMGIPAQLFETEKEDRCFPEFIDLTDNQLGSKENYSFGSLTALRFYPQHTQPLQMLTMQSILSNLATKEPDKILDTLLKLHKTYRSLCMISASSLIKKYLALCDHITDCLEAFEKDPLGQTKQWNDETWKIWNNALNNLEKEKWDVGINLFFNRLASHPLHKKFLQNWCIHKLQVLEQLPLDKLALEFITIPHTLLHICMDASPGYFLRRLACAQEIYAQQIQLNQKLHERSKAILMANMKAVPEEESPQQRIDIIEKVWHDAIEEFKVVFYQWSEEMQEAFFSLCPGKLKSELGKK